MKQQSITIEFRRRYHYTGSLEGVIRLERALQEHAVEDAIAGEHLLHQWRRALEKAATEDDRSL